MSPFSERRRAFLKYRSALAERAWRQAGIRVRESAKRKRTPIGQDPLRFGFDLIQGTSIADKFSPAAALSSS
jgi:hypothetical protein